LIAAASGATGAAAAKLACRGVWKLFGPEPEGFLAANPAPAAAELAAGGYVPAVIDASLAVA
jgi:glycine betaine/proline transport system ATP-binding protein